MGRKRKTRNEYCAEYPGRRPKSPRQDEAGLSALPSSDSESGCAEAGEGGAQTLNNECKGREVRVYEVEVIVIPVLLVASFIFTFLFILVMRFCPFTCQHLLGTKKKRGAFPGVAAPISQPPQGNEYIALSAPPAQPPEIPRELISRVLEPLPSQLPLLYPGFSRGGANITLQRGQFATPTQPTGGRAVIVRALNGESACLCQWDSSLPPPSQQGAER
ncbi:UNVERIFIED_CONTAM: hypothetical protein FKN15_050298 [Acipenser sinensis]